jgi:hypothetical protein
MSQVGGRPIDPADIQLLVRGARDVIERVKGLRSVADSAESQEWADFRAERAENQWAELIATLRDRPSTYLPGALKSIITNGTPLAEAPADLQQAADRASGFAGRLALDYQRIILPLLGLDGLVRPEVDSALTPLMREISVEFD